MKANKAIAALPMLVAPQNPPQTAQPDGTVPPQRRLVPKVAPFDAHLEFALKSVALRAEPFPMTQVRLRPNSVYHDAQEWNREYMERLEADRLLYTFRANAGLPLGAAKPLGGWEQPENGQRSSELRVISRPFSVGERAAVRLHRRQGREGESRLHGCRDGQVPGETRRSISERFPHNLVEPARERRAGMGAVLHHPQNHGCHGNVYRLAGNTQALRVLEGMSAWADEWTASKTDGHMQRILTIEFGGIAETLYHLAAETNDDRWASIGTIATGCT